MLAEARAERLPARYLKFDDLSTKFEAYRKAYWTKHSGGTSPDAWEEREKRSLAESVKYLCQREILHQGYEWRCRQCFYNNWVAVDELKRTMVCQVCGSTEPVPVADSWHFRVNPFVLEGLREHGLLPAIWCLAKCAKHVETSFFYLGPHELFFTKENAEVGKPDGVVRLIEAKASAQRIDTIKIAELTKRLRPDVVTLAVMEAQSPRLAAKLNELRGQLAGSDIAVELMTLKPDDIDESPTLPTGTSYRLRVF